MKPQYVFKADDNTGAVHLERRRVVAGNIISSVALILGLVALLGAVGPTLDMWRDAVIHNICK